MGGWVFFAIFVGIAVVSAISHVLKNQQATKPPRQKRKQRTGEPVRISSDTEQDRFLAEIERLCRKAVVAKSVPVVKPKPQPKKARPLQSSSQRLEELPVASVIAPGRRAALVGSAPPETSVATIGTIATIMEVHKPMAAGGATAAKMASMSQTLSGRSETPLGKEMLSMFRSHSAIPMAVIMTEVLGPPKCKR